MDRGGQDPASSPRRSSSPVAIARVPLADSQARLPSAIASKLESAQSWAEERKRSSAAASRQQQQQQDTKWNTAHLGRRLGVDATAAGAAGAMVAPIITIIDRAIIENASNHRTIMQSAMHSLQTIISRPHAFLFSRPFALIFCLYTGTYLSANLTDTATSTVRKDVPPSHVTSGTSKFAITSATNLSLCLYKDSQFTRLFGAASHAPRPIPPASYALFAVRDMLTIFASFNLPPIIAPLLPVSAELERYASRASVAQFLAPAAVQAFSTPLHLLGLDLYNRAGPDVSPASRFQKVARDWGKSFAARVCRIVPAFGVGGVVNSGVRRALMQKIE